MPFSLIMEYPRAGSNFLTFTYYLQIFNTHGGFAGEDFLLCVWFWLRVFLMDRLQSSPCQYLICDAQLSFTYCTSSKQHQTECAHNWRCPQALPV